MKPSKTDIEDAQFASFREQVKDCPRGEVVRIEDDIDFKIGTPTGVVGIEITRLTTASTAKNLGQLSAANRICDLAMALGLKAGLPNRLVDVYFSPDHDLTRVHRQSLAAMLFSKVQDTLSSHPKSKWSLEQWRDKLPKEVSAITIHDWPHAQTPLWQPAGGGQIVEECAAGIQATIDLKHESLRKYRKTCYACWLVIVSDVWEWSEFEPNKITLNRTFTSGFDRTYFMMYGYRKVWRLNTKCDS